jgi:diguanylate cyclase (GGDEF)-like protein/PAS domain S-box-containing protein
VPVAILVKNAEDMRFILVNRLAEQFIGMTRNEILGQTVQEVLPPSAAEFVTANDEEALAAPEPIVAEYELNIPGRGARVTSGRTMVVRFDSKPKYVLSVVQDLTDRKQAEARIAYLAEHDPLTELPNRAAFQQHLEAILKQAKTSGEQLAVLCLGLDSFKETNDVFGPSVGDATLREVAQRLGGTASGTFLSRVGGDEFALLATGPQPATAEALIEQLQGALDHDIEIEGHDLRIGASIGVAVFPGDGNDVATLVGNADAAMDRAKADGRGIVRFFDGNTDRRLRERRALQHDLRSALARGELAVFYQPQGRLDRTIVGFEALARWRHPTRGLVSPATFISLAEESGLIFPISAWILREACREAASWPRPLPIAVNLSPMQFRQGDLTGLVRSTLAETGLVPNRLELEITEGVLISDHHRAFSILTELKSLGVRIALDDFGTGYSSLSYLHLFPFDKIKIDRPFIANLQSNPQSAAIIRAIVALGNGLGLPILVEGVETEEQLAFLIGASCDQMQGFLLGGPRPIEAYTAVVGRGPSPPRDGI